MDQVLYLRRSEIIFWIYCCTFDLNHYSSDIFIAILFWLNVIIEKMLLNSHETYLITGLAVILVEKPRELSAPPNIHRPHSVLIALLFCLFMHLY